MSKTKTKKQYRYTLLKTDGSEEVIGVYDKPMPLAKMQEYVGGLVQLVPKVYYENKGWGRCEVYVDEEGLFKDYEDNLHFPLRLDLGMPFPIKGNALKKDKV